MKHAAENRAGPSDLRVLRIVEEAGTALAFPAQTVYLAGGGGAASHGEKRA
jgi:hypothetical protein